MSDVKDRERAKLSRDILVKQIEESKNAINYAQEKIATLSIECQQQQGVLKYAEHLLAQFEIPDAPKPPLEVK